MKRVNEIGSFLVLGIVVVWLIGCGPVEPVPQNRLQRRLKIGDLAPSDPIQLPEQVTFQIASLEIDAEHIDLLQEAITELHNEPLRFASMQAFLNSGFSAGFGQAGDWGVFTAKMDAARPRQIYLNTLVCLDDKGLDIASRQLVESQTVIYKDAGGAVQEVILEPGQAAWSIRSRPIPDMPGVAETTIQAVYRERTDITSARLARTIDVKQTVLGPTTFSIKISPGQFLVLSPHSIDELPQSLAHLLFPHPRDAKAIRFYLIFCTRVGR
ncbi:MAG: hypothetical protein JW828_03850 [Sedimentisphaerales bacterium]|nr:hypothetical protein [Sedimentisphaerales bacterium]